MAKCEWDPVNDRLAQILAPDVEIGCKNTATVSVGGGAYHLCASCADLPRFKRYRSRVELKPLKPLLPMTVEDVLVAEKEVEKQSEANAILAMRDGRKHGK